MFVNPTEIDFSTYDVIVAGSGPAGAMISRRAVAQNMKVLLLETGGAEFEQVTQDSYGSIHGQGHFDSSYWPTHWVRALGGTSNVWAGWVAPLRERNLKDWPITRSELSPWYGVAAKELGRNPVITTWNGQGPDGFLSSPFSLEPPKRYDELDGADLWNRDDIHVLLGTSLNRLTPRSDRRGIEKVGVFTEGFGHQEFDVEPNQDIVLAAGGMGNAQILLASDAGNGVAVGNEFDQVGRYLMEHPHFYDCASIVVRNDFKIQEPGADFGEFVPTLVPNDQTYSSLGDGLDASFSLHETSLNEDDVVEQFVLKQVGGQGRIFDLTARTEMKADPENRVQRIFGQDPAGLPKLRATCVLNANDYRVVLKYLQRLGETLAAQNLGRIRIRNDELFSEFTGGGHTMGTTRMGTDPKTSVTDANCRVHNYENLFVAGSSLFSTGGYANPTLTIVALAARLGDYLGASR